MIQEVLNDERAFRDYDRLGGAGGRDGNYWGFPQWVDSFEFWGSETCDFVPVEDLELVGEVEFFKEPENTLAARSIKPGKVN